jgi:hypothetical protein
MGMIIRMSTGMTIPTVTRRTMRTVTRMTIRMVTPVIIHTAIHMGARTSTRMTRVMHRFRQRR